MGTFSGVVLRTKLAVHWIPEHVGGEDLDAFRAMQPRSIKIVNPDANRCQQAFEACPNALFVYRSHSLSEQKAEMLADPAGTGRRHARELSEQVAMWKPANLPLEQVVVTGINEPDVDPDHHGAVSAVVAYTVALLDSLLGYGMRGGALNLSVGWPSNHGITDAPPDWLPYEPVRQAILRGRHFLVLHEYWPKEGPQNQWGWLAGRYTQCPWQVPILIGECGLDQYTVDGSLGGPSGWQHWVSEVDYLAQLAEYDRRICLDARIHSAQVFTWDYGSNHWEFHNVRNMRHKLVPYHQTADWPEAPAADAEDWGDRRVSRWRGLIEANANGLDPRVIAAIIALESAGRADAVSSAGAVGLMQVMPGEKIAGRPSAEQLLNPELNIRWGVKILQGNLTRAKGHLDWALCYYYGASGGPNTPAGKQYLAAFRRAWSELWPGVACPVDAEAPIAGAPTVDPTVAIVDAAWRAIGVPRNPDAALYKAAKLRDLGRPVTAEYHVGDYVAQAFDGGIVYCKAGDWGNVKVVGW